MKVALTTFQYFPIVDLLAEGLVGESLPPRTYASDSQKAHPSVGFLFSEHFHSSAGYHPRLSPSRSFVSVISRVSNSALS